jgi:hypothetical protein
MTKPIEAIADLMNDLKELDSVAIVAKDILPFISTPGDMVNGTCVFDPQRSSHENSLAESSVGLQDLTPIPRETESSQAIDIISAL